MVLYGFPVKNQEPIQKEKYVCYLSTQHLKARVIVRKNGQLYFECGNCGMIFPLQMNEDDSLNTASVSSVVKRWREMNWKDK